MSLTPFCNFIARSPEMTAAASEWALCLGAELWQQIRNQLFIRDGVAASLTPAGLDRPLRVVPLSNGTYSGVCQITGSVEATGLTAADVAGYRLNLQAFKEWLAAALGIDADPSPPPKARGWFPVGMWSPVHGVDVVVHFLVAMRCVQKAVYRLLADAAGPFLLLTPKRPSVDVATWQAIERKRGAVAALHEVLEWAGPRFRAAPSWTTFTNAFCARVAPERMVLPPPPYEFRKTGDFWTVRFDGMTTFLKDGLGLSYIRHLLAAPHKKVFAPDLLAAVSGKPIASIAGTAGALADRDALEGAKHAYLELQEELSQAIRNNDQAAQVRLRSEVERITDYLKQVKGFGGRTREASDDADKVRRAMTQAIGRAIDALRAKDRLPAAARHLENAIKTGLFMSYEPEQELPWQL